MPKFTPTYSVHRTVSCLDKFANVLQGVRDISRVPAIAKSLRTVHGRYFAKFVKPPRAFTISYTYMYVCWHVRTSQSTLCEPCVACRPSLVSCSMSILRVTYIQCISMEADSVACNLERAITRNVKSPTACNVRAHIYNMKAPVSVLRLAVRHT